MPPSLIILAGGDSLYNEGKPNGYRCLHLIVKVPVFLSEKREIVPVEIQLRTIAMDYWASLEHMLKYKNDDQDIEKYVEMLKEQIDLLFIGDGMYFGGIAKETKEFIRKLDASKVGCSAAFSTSGGSWPFGPTGITARLKEQGVSTHSETFRCHGAAFGAVFPSHPNEKDLENAREFAEKIVASVSQA